MATPHDLNLITLGLEGNVDISPHLASGLKSLPNMTTPLGLPPVLPDIQQELEEFLLHPEKLPIHDIDKAQRYWGRTSNVESLYDMDLCPLQTTITVDRNPTTGHLTGFKEDILRDTGSSAKNSTSLRRPPGPPSDGLRGSSTNYPFWPGGLDELPEIKLNTEENENVEDLDKDLLTTAPGLQEGVQFPSKSLGHIVKRKTEKVSFLKLSDLLNPDDEFDIDWQEDEKVDKMEDAKPGAVPSDASNHDIDEIVKVEKKLDGGVIQLKDTQEVPKEFEFAVWVDLNTSVANFHKRIPDMAYKWHFELDVFQKQAILHLEQHDNVFVAAHTSAGKTVIAEYAIALSLKHMTKTIYTSPIKALSNQKFRDFKTTFSDVGLVTGDVQINQEASCLIMTTEILRSMLYNGSDVIRDLEWVIFDEVHYINDTERGVVWEEVLIMLPHHVNIILLSATVPNTMEFADWIGRTKKRKVYVVSTPKRPVPLEHFLYTGNSNKTSTEQFLLVDATSNFMTSGYNKALEAKRERASKSSQSYGPKGPRGGHPLQDKNVWLSIIEMLRKKDKLPVVSFIFSKRKIEENSEHLKSVDLTTAHEKSEIHLFIQRCISKLKGNDRELPQVKTMTETLKRGIGIHHSGVLPILKEVVEMLFGKGLVKVLFATETFAMGVNMPARTVVFDSIRKHDGTGLRDLLPGEYIQMAGRAGRRGLDTTGTVIILCKGDVPEMSDLHRMMLGKPTQLSSQFRLTYSMILNLLRVEELRVEDMMRRSFSEFHNQRDMTRRQGILKVVEQQVEQMPDVVDYSGDLEAYYRCCDDYYSLHAELQKLVMSHPHAIKMLSPGRLVVIDTAKHQNSLAAILKVGSPSSKERTFTVLVLSEQQDKLSFGDGTKKDSKTADAAETLLPKPYIKTPLYRPEGPCSQEVSEVKASNISSITVKSLKINADRIMDDVKKRQMPRFRNDPPGQSTSVATQELLRVVESNPDGVPAINPVKDLGLRDLDQVEQFSRLDAMQKKLETFSCTDQPYFLENFEKLRSYMKLKQQYEDLKFQLSDASLQLLPEYHQRMEVLRSLGYISSNHTVELKGRVACEISQHELIITELVFENALTALHPTEIAAVLSSTVFQQRNASAPNLSPRLEECKEGFKTIARKIGQVQKECGLLMPVEDYVDKFNFNLMEVVFEWARGMPFAEITALTDVQEGIIVRCIQRLDEVLKDVRNAARIIGDEVLKQKMEESSDLIKRDIVFAASLYTQ